VKYHFSKVFTLSLSLSLSLCIYIYIIKILLKNAVLLIDIKKLTTHFSKKKKNPQVKELRKMGLVALYVKSIHFFLNREITFQQFISFNTQLIAVACVFLHICMLMNFNLIDTHFPFKC